MTLLARVSNYTVLPVLYADSVTHVIYACAHASPKKTHSESLPEGRTLFIVNVPPDATERELVLLFKYAGTVERVIFGGEEQDEEDSDSDDELPLKRARQAIATDGAGPSDAPSAIIPLPAPPLRVLRRSGGTAHIVFLDASSVTRALASPRPREWPRSDEPSGLAHYIARYHAERPPLDAVRAHADSYMAVFDAEQARMKQQSNYRKGEAIVDEDGFTLVTRGGAYGQTLGGGVVVATKKFQETGETRSSARKKKKKGPMEKPAFYAFQKAEKQRNRMIDLKKRWEEDKAKVEKLKESRRFKPY